MLQQHGKQLDDNHKPMSFGLDRKINSSHMIKHSWILREISISMRQSFCVFCMITVFKVLCITRTATVSLFYFGLVSHIRTFSNFEEFALQCGNTNPHAVLYKVLQSLLISLFNLPFFNDNINISVCILS